jgi:hypothetical protein
MNLAMRSRFPLVTGLFLAAILAGSAALGRGRQSGSPQKSKEACDNQLFNDIALCDGKPNGTGYDSKLACQARARAAYSQCLHAAGITINKPPGVNTTVTSVGTSTPAPTPVRPKVGTATGIKKLNGESSSPTATPKVDRNRKK